jgi:hypothetical protein
MIFGREFGISGQATFLPRLAGIGRAVQLDAK